MDQVNKDTITPKVGNVSKSVMQVQRDRVADDDSMGTDSGSADGKAATSKILKTEPAMDLTTINESRLKSSSKRKKLIVAGETKA